MGGYRARGALATLALASVVLVAVVLAGTVSMPIVQPGSPIAGGRRNNSFGVVVPGDVVASPEATPPGEVDESEGPVVVLKDPDEPADPNDGPAGFPTVFPSEPPAPRTPDPGPGPGPGPGPNPPPSEGPRPTPSPSASPAPYVPEPPEPPLPTEPPVTGKPPRGHTDHPAKDPKTGPRGRVGKPPVVIVTNPDAKRRDPKPGKGPRWRPKDPARQAHPKQPDKWSRVGTRTEPRPNAHADGRNHRASDKRNDAPGRQVRARRHGVMPQGASVRPADRGHKKSHDAQHGKQRRGKDRGHGHGRGKPGRRH